MTSEIQRTLQVFEKRISQLEQENKTLRSVTTFPIDIQKVLVARGFFKLDTPLSTGVLYSNNGVISAVQGQSKGVYVATVGGGAANNFMSVTDGIVTSI